MPASNFVGVVNIPVSLQLSKFRVKTGMVIVRIKNNFLCRNDCFVPNIRKSSLDISLRCVESEFTFKVIFRKYLSFLLAGIRFYKRHLVKKVVHFADDPRVYHVYTFFIRRNYIFLPSR